jgi:hypothetical protein
LTYVSKILIIVKFTDIFLDTSNEVICMASVKNVIGQTWHTTEVHKNREPKVSGFTESSTCVCIPWVKGWYVAHECDVQVWFPNPTIFFVTLLYLYLDVTFITYVVFPWSFEGRSSSKKRIWRLLRLIGKWVKNPCTSLDTPWNLLEAETPRFQDNQHKKVVSLSGSHIGHLYLQKISLLLIPPRRWVEPRPWRGRKDYTNERDIR